MFANTGATSHHQKARVALKQQARKTGDTILISIQQMNVASTNKKARVALRQRALLLAKRARSRAALAPTPSLYICVVTPKTGEVLPPASGHRKCGGEFRANGAARHEIFARVGVAGRRWWSGHRAFGFGAATAQGDELLGAVKGGK